MNKEFLQKSEDEDKSMVECEMLRHVRCVGRWVMTMAGDLTSRVYESEGVQQVAEEDVSSASGPEKRSYFASRAMARMIKRSLDEVKQTRAVAEFLATEALAKFWDGVYPVDARGIAVRMGLKVLFTDSLKRSTAGMILWPSDQEAPTIFVNQDLPSQRQRFTIAHEIGHYVEHMPKRFIGNDAPFGYEDSVDLFAARIPTKSGRPDRRECEIFADSFAHALLMPEWELRSLVGLGGTIDQLSEYFGVSRVSMSNRLSMLQIDLN